MTNRFIIAERLTSIHNFVFSLKMSWPQKGVLDWVNLACFENYTRETSITHSMRCALCHHSWVLPFLLQFWKLTPLLGVAGSISDYKWPEAAYRQVFVAILGICFVKESLECRGWVQTTSASSSDYWLCCPYVISMLCLNTLQHGLVTLRVAPPTGQVVVLNVYITKGHISL